jgi:DNA polymerase I
MSLSFWILDVASERRNRTPEVILWGISDGNERILVRDRSFSAHLYVVPHEGVSTESLISAVRGLSFNDIITNAEVVRKRYFGNPTEAIRFDINEPEDIEKLARAVDSLPQVKMVLEHDIRYAMQYMLERNVLPCGWVEADVEAMGHQGIRVDSAYSLLSKPRMAGRDDIPKLRQMALHAIYLSRRGTPNPDRDPIAIMSIATSDGDVKQLVMEGEDDSKLLSDFVELCGQKDPDVIYGFRSNRGLWQYLTRRANRSGISLSVGRGGEEPHMSVYGHVSVSGRANVDLFDIANEITDIKLETLEGLADYLGIRREDDWEAVEQQEVYSYWGSRRSDLMEFGRQASVCTLEIGKRFLEYLVELSRLTGIPLDHVMAASTGFRVEWYLMREAVSRGELIPPRIERPYTPYLGAIVLSPKPGLHDNIVSLDFKSMYPSLMIAYNISPDTLVRSDDVDVNEYNIAPEVGHMFRRSPPGFYKEALLKLIETRDALKAKISRSDIKEDERKILEARQMAMKLIANASYGYTGWIGARWYVREVAESTTAWGRASISKAIDACKRIGLELVYGDTDSLFVRNEPEKVELLLSFIRSELGLDIKIDTAYKRVLFTEAKKRYAGITEDGRLEVVGLEAVRGDYPNVARKAQRALLEIILRDPSNKKAALEFVRSLVERISSGSYPYKDFVIWKEISKGLEEYKVKAAHVEAAKRMMEEGCEINPGDKVGYVVVKGPGQLYDRSIPYFMTDKDHLDYEYYISSLVMPPLLRALEAAGISAQDIQRRKGSLFDFT